MRDYSHIRRAEGAGRWLGTLLRRLTFRDGGGTRLRRQSLAVRVLLWATGIAIVGLLLLFAVWIALVVVLAWAAVKFSQPTGKTADADFELVDSNDHRKSLFYHPLSYNDDPDPRAQAVTISFPVGVLAAWPTAIRPKSRDPMAGHAMFQPEKRPNVGAASGPPPSSRRAANSKGRIGRNVNRLIHQ